MKQLILMLLIGSLLINGSLTPNYEIKVINYEKKSPYLNADGYYYPGDQIILINGMSYTYRVRLVHEVVHAICLKLFDNIDAGHNRCFTDGYNKGFSIY